MTLENKKKTIMLILIFCLGCLTIDCGVSFCLYGSTSEVLSFGNNVISYSTVNNIEISRVEHVYSLFLIFITLLYILLFRILRVSKTSIQTVVQKRFNQTVNMVIDMSHTIGCFFNKHRLTRAAFIICGISLALFFSFIINTSLIVKCFVLSVGLYLFDNQFNNSGKNTNVILRFSIMFGVTVNTVYGLKFMTGIYSSHITNLILIVVCIALHYWENESIVKYLAYIVLTSILFTCVFTEICFTLKCYNKYNVTILAILYIVGIITSFFIGFNVGKRKKFRLIEEGSYYTICVIAYSWISNMRHVTQVNFFEMSNHGVAISETILNKRIPIIDNFDAHMLSNYIPGILYYVINKDYEGSLLVPYAYIYSVLLYLILFKVLCYYISKKIAFLVISFFPMELILIDTSALPNLAVFMVGIYMIIIYNEWQRIKRPWLGWIFWGGFYMCLCLGLDVGFTFGGSALIMILTYLARNREFKRLLLFIIQGISMLAIGIGIIASLMRAKYGMIAWMERFINTVFSNQNWAKGPISTGHIICYYILYPALTFFVIVALLNYCKFSQEQKNIVEFLVLAFVLNASRTVVRHTTIEDTRYVTRILNLLVIILLIYFLSKIYNYICFEIDGVNGHRFNTECKKLMVLVFLIFVSVVGSMGERYFSQADQTVNRLVSTLNSNIRENVLEEKVLVGQVREIIDTVLDKDETFLDFSNMTELYPLLKRENPLYVNQSPALLNGVKGQIYAIEDIENYSKSIPIVIMGEEDSDLCQYTDDIANVDRYYLLIEYIYSRYRPLCNIGKVSLWCLNEKWDYYHGLIDEELAIDYNTSIKVEHKLGYIPYLWANKDIDRIDDYELLQFGNFDISKLDGVVHYIIMRIDTKQDIVDYKISALYANGSTEEYQFNLIKGSHYYKVRISNDWDWHISQLIALDGRSDDRVSNTEFFMAKSLNK